LLDPRAETPTPRRRFGARDGSKEFVANNRSRDFAIFAMGKLAESCDSETDTHRARIGNYCRTLARRLMTMNLAGYDAQGSALTTPTVPAWIVDDEPARNV
jgi:hypothetical protein